MERPQILQRWSYSPLGKFRQRVTQILRFQQPWKAIGHEEVIEDRDDKWGGGLSLDTSASTRKAPGVKQLFGLLFRTLLSLLSLLRYLLPRRGIPVRQKKGNEIHPLAYLDGLRGFGSMIIFTGHTMSRRWKWVPAFILNNAILQVPFRGGNACLNTFFFISGYALTWRLTGYMQTKKYDKIMDTLNPGVFKRYARLFLPVIMMNTVSILLVPIGVVVLPRHLQKSLDESGGNLFKWWLCDLFHALDPWAHTATYWHKKAAGSHFLEQFWSINTEFRQSMMLFCFCMATCKMTSTKRKGMIWGSLFICMAYQVQTAAMAFFGMWLAECRQQGLRELEAKKQLDINKQPQTSAPNAALLSTHTFDDSIKAKSDAQDPETMKTPLRPDSRRFTFTSHREQSELLQRLRKPFLIIMFMCSPFILRDSHEAYKWDTFPQSVINIIIPGHWPGDVKMHVHQVIGAFMLLYPLDQLPTLQWPLVQPFAQYLGELSFGIYGVHITVRYIVWEPRLLKWWRDYFGEDVTDHPLLLWPAYLLMALCVLWAAEAFRRMDMQIVKIVAKLEAWAFKQ